MSAASRGGTPRPELVEIAAVGDEDIGAMLRALGLDPDDASDIAVVRRSLKAWGDYRLVSDCICEPVRSANGWRIELDLQCQSHGRVGRPGREPE